MAIESHPDLPVRLLAGAVARDRLTVLRDRDTDHPAFRTALADLGRAAGHGLAEEMGTEPVDVETPLGTADGARLPDDDVVLVAVLRAAVPFVEGLLDVFPRASEGVVSASRQESGRRPDGSFPVEVEYVNLPEVAGRTVVVADPMLATGSTVTAVLEELGGAPDRLLVLAGVSAPEGIERVRAAHPEAELFSVAVDRGLDEEGFIVPGLGDAGDRAFRTT